jgi:hypothetical protein
MRLRDRVDNASMQRVTADERRARLVRRQLLAPPERASSVAAVARALVAIHSTDPATVFLSVRARTRGLDPAAIERELYDARTVVRMLGMRRTLFVVPREARPVVQAACTNDVAARERAKLRGWLAAGGQVEDVDALLETAEHAALAAVDAAGEASTAEIVASNEILATKIELGSGRWTLSASVGSRILLVLAAEGKLVRARPRGTWISGQYRWTLPRTWLGDEPPLPQADEARAALVRSWLERYGPGTESDLRWWTGLGARPVRAALAALGVVDVDLDGASGYVLPGDLDPAETAEPSAVLLPMLDSTTMGWKERGWYLGPHAQVLFDRNGNAGPTVWWDGRIVGGWSQRREGEVVFRLLEDIGVEATAAVAQEAARLQAWLGDVRISPGFLPPFQRALAA